jgi:hypothetical protein
METFNQAYHILRGIEAMQQGIKYSAKRSIQKYTDKEEDD